MSNVQLSSRESVVVYRDPDTKRILGFGPEYAKPAFPPGTKYTTETCLHARDVERRMLEYRMQCVRDAEESTLRKIEADRPMREAIRQSILQRNQEVDPWNRDLNNALLKSMDYFYEKACRARMNVEAALVAERYEESKKSTDIALESRFFRNGDLKHA